MAPETALDPQTVINKLTRERSDLLAHIDRLIAVEYQSASAQNALDQQVRVYRELNALASAIVELSDPDETLALVARFVVNQLGFECCAVFRQGVGGEFRVTAVDGFYYLEEGEPQKLKFQPSDEIATSLRGSASTRLGNNDVVDPNRVLFELRDWLVCSISLNPWLVMLVGNREPDSTVYPSICGNNPQRLGLDTLLSQVQASIAVQESTRSLRVVLTALKQREQAMAQDRGQASLFQRSILPGTFSHRHLRLAVIYRPAEEVGGDFYDYVQIERDYFRVILFDVAGHGVQAALRTMAVKAAYDEVKRDLSLSPAGVLQRLNQLVITRHGRSSVIFTACCVDLRQLATGWQVTYASAGQPLPIILGTSAPPEPSLGAWMGVVDDVDAQEAAAHLSQGDRLLLYTDGLCEQQDPIKQEFGVSRIKAAALEVADSLEASIAHVLENLKRFAQMDTFEDDVTVVALQIGEDAQCNPR